MSTKKVLVTLSLLILGAVAAGAVTTSVLARDGAAAMDGPWLIDGGSSFEIGTDDGVIKDAGSISPFADDLPAIANLDPDLRSAMQDAARDAIDDGVDFVITSGWRSAAYQQQLLDEAVQEYGSAEAAGEFVLPPDRSRHVTGEAVDVGYTDANSWLSQHGDTYGLCQIYANEMWHFELATTPGGECPAQLSDATVG
jgi:D-alanyl-D-alanine carboxypeptidase